MIGRTRRPQSGLSVGSPAHALRAVPILLTARPPLVGRKLGSLVHRRQATGERRDEADRATMTATQAPNSRTLLCSTSLLRTRSWSAPLPATTMVKE